MIASSSLFAMDFFSITENFMLKTNLMRPVISFTDLLSYMRFGLMKQDAAKETRIVPVRPVEMRFFLCDHNRAVRKSIPKPVATDLDDAGGDPGVAPISDHGSVDSLLFSCASESEGDIWGNNNYDNDASNAHERANLVPPDFNGNEGVQPTPNIIQASEGAPHRTRGKARVHQPAVWRHGADGKLKCISLSVICQEYKKLNCGMFALTFGQQEMPPMAHKMSKK